MGIAAADTLMEIFGFERENKMAIEKCFNEKCKHHHTEIADNCGNKTISNKMYCPNYIRGPVEEEVIKSCLNCNLQKTCCDDSGCSPPERDLWEPIVKECANCLWGGMVDSPCMMDGAPDCIQPDVALWEPMSEATEQKGQGPFKTQVGGTHYKDNFPFCQPSEFFARNNIEFIPGCVCKYVLRHKIKGGIEDLRKAKHYLEMISWSEYGVEL